MKSFKPSSARSQSVYIPDQTMREDFVFFDHRGKRWPRFKRISFLSSLLLFIAAVLFVQSLVLPSDLSLPPSVQQLKSQLKALKQTMGWEPAKPLWLDYAKKNVHAEKAGTASLRKRHSVAPEHAKDFSIGASQAQSGEIRLGFYEGWDPDSLNSLKAHADQLTHICPDWMHFTDGTGKLQVATDQQVIDIAEKNNLQLMPQLRNLGEGDLWHAEAVEWIINGGDQRQSAFMTQLITALNDMDADGVVLDWQQVDPSYRDAMTRFLTRLAKSLHQEQLELWICIPVGRELKVFDLDQLSLSIDHFVALLHDENAEDDPPGPIASQPFFKGWLTTLVGYGRPQQWIISQGAYGYDWAKGAKSGEHISFQDVMSRAGHSAQSGCAFHPPEANPHFVYDDGKNVHTVWFLDAVTFLNQLSLVRAHHAGGIAINRLGNEDSAVWQVLAMATENTLSPQQLAILGDISSDDGIGHIGDGNLVTIADVSAKGKRLITYNPKAALGLRYSEEYQQFPDYLTILHQGRGPDDGVALTFDDGPDDEWTPQILDILRQRGTKATFFMIGANMEKHPDIVRRVIAEGHMIGVHTYSHPNIALVSSERAHLELNATQRLIESITGHRTLLFRPPYNADTNPRDPEELIPIKLAQSMGYVTVTEDIDTEDWDKPGIDVILSRVKEGRQQGGNIILMHDAGGDRSQTVAALPHILDYIDARGDRLLPLEEIVGIPGSQLMPVIPVSQQPWTRLVSNSGFAAIHEVTNFFWAFMIVATVLIVLKTLVVSWLAIRSRGQQTGGETPYMPAVSVLIAAYNEEKVIAETLRTVLRTTYAGPMEVIVVDDGSNDDTAAIVAAMAAADGRIHLIRQNNRGKALALRNGLNAVSHAIVVTLDADTQFTPATIGALVQPLANPRVAAVSGRARVGNPKTLFARFQSLEYSCGFNLDRRAYHRLNCITVVPGAISALRLNAVIEAGGISNDTLAEDTDLTLALHRIGYRIAYTAQAVAWTEAPETLRTFAKQRFRWAFGTLQCLWKHREMVFNSRYRALGWFSLPSAWFFNIFLVAMGSVIDFILLCSLLVSPANLILYGYFFIFLAADLLLAAVACRVEREPLSQIWLVLPMRFIYRPVLNYVVVKAILRAFKGVWVGWGKLDRTASVSAPCQPMKG